MINGVAVKLVGEGTFGTVYANTRRAVAWKILKGRGGKFLRAAYKKETDAVRVLGRELTGEKTSKESAAQLCAKVANLPKQPLCTLRRGPSGWQWDNLPTRTSLAVVQFEDGRHQAAPLEVDLALNRVCELSNHFLVHGGWPENVLQATVTWAILTSADEHTMSSRVIEMQFGKCFRHCVEQAYERQPLMERFATVGADLVRYLQRINVRHVDMKQGNWIVLPNGTAHGQLKLADIDAARCNDGVLSGCGTYSPVNPDDFYYDELRTHGARVQNLLMAWCFACAACDPEHFDQNYATDYATLVDSKDRICKALRYNRRVVAPLLIGLVDFAIEYWK
ncbi:MAG: hypothetical protein CL678_00910 [Bdellovibrionaceae bacterium]|nr:hypothetical protein [Pseudobdellovibrionaceae bacterium]